MSAHIPIDTVIKGPALVIDASNHSVEVAILSTDGAEWLSRAQGTTTALESIHSLIEHCLTQSRLQLPDIRSWIACTGPGGIIGLRLAQTTFACWHQLPELQSVPLYVYDSLALAHLNLLQQSPQPDAGWILCAGRRGTWYARSLTTAFAARQAPEILSDQALENLQPPLWQIRQRPIREPVFASAQPLQCRLPLQPHLLFTEGFLNPAAQFQLFDPTAPTYAPWSGQRHRG